MVVISFPAAALMGVMQARIARPLSCTVHAPQSAMPHPNFVPVRCNSSRKYQSSGISGSPSNEWLIPFIFNWIMIFSCTHWELAGNLLLGIHRSEEHTSELQSL